jgi:hypothetical protein
MLEGEPIGGRNYNGQYIRIRSAYRKVADFRATGNFGVRWPSYQALRLLWDLVTMGKLGVSYHSD